MATGITKQVQIRGEGREGWPGGCNPRYDKSKPEMPYFTKELK